MFEDWAQPVTSKPWGVVCVVADWLKRRSGYRLFVYAAHRSWEKACGLHAAE